MKCVKEGKGIPSTWHCSSMIQLYNKDCQEKWHDHINKKRLTALKNVV
jgi:hypothetical protein